MRPKCHTNAHLRRPKKVCLCLSVCLCISVSLSLSRSVSLSLLSFCCVSHCECTDKERPVFCKTLAELVELQIKPAVNLTVSEAEEQKLAPAVTVCICLPFCSVLRLLVAVCVSCYASLCCVQWECVKCHHINELEPGLAVKASDKCTNPKCSAVYSSSLPLPESAVKTPSKRKSPYRPVPHVKRDVSLSLFLCVWLSGFVSVSASVSLPPSV